MTVASKLSEGFGQMFRNQATIIQANTGISYYAKVKKKCAELKDQRTFPGLRTRFPVTLQLNCKMEIQLSKNPEIVLEVSTILVHLYSIHAGQEYATFLLITGTHFYLK